MSAIKVLHLSSEKTWRGGEQQIAYLIEASREMGVEVVVAVRRHSDFETWCRQAGLDVHAMGFRNGLDLLTAKSVADLVKRCGAQLVHVHSGKSHSIAYLASKLGLSVPIIVHRRVDFSLKTSGPSLGKYNHPQVKAIICVSHAIADMVRQAVARPDRVHVVHSGIDFARFAEAHTNEGWLRRELNLSASTWLIGNVSALAPHKDYPTFLRTAKRVCASHRDVHFVIAGEGDERGPLEKMVESEGIQKRVTFLGFRKNVPGLLAELDLFLMTSKTEGLGTTIIDAMHSRLPVVATRAGGIPELVKNGVNGYLCKPGDDACLADRVGALLNDPAMRTAMGDAGHSHSAAFGKNEMARAVVEVYRGVLGS